MQNFKPKFQQKTKERISTIQSCIRTNDIDLWGDGTHLCFFRMVGCFSFGNKDDYSKVVDMWLSIIKEIGLEITTVHVHPNSDHRSLFENKGTYQIVDDQDCEWSDGNIGGYCSEFYVNDIEIGNLVNPMGDSVDVGFGLERICKLLGEYYEPTYDLEQFLNHCWHHNICPGPKGRNHTVKKVLRKWLKEQSRNKNPVFKEWIPVEEKKMFDAISLGRRLLRKHFHKSEDWWLSTTGLLPEEVQIIKKEYLNK
jgi:hypothetical protein